MATFTKVKLSASTDGRPVKVAATAIGSAQRFTLVQRPLRRTMRFGCMR